MNGSWISLQSAVHDRSALIFPFPGFSASSEPTVGEGGGELKQ